MDLYIRFYGWEGGGFGPLMSYLLIYQKYHWLRQEVFLNIFQLRSSEKDPQFEKEDNANEIQTHGPDTIIDYGKDRQNMVNRWIIHLLSQYTVTCFVLHWAFKSEIFTFQLAIDSWSSNKCLETMKLRKVRLSSRRFPQQISPQRKLYYLQQIAKLRRKQLLDRWVLNKTMQVR